MAKPAWLTISPSSGNGNESVNYSGTEHTGRTARSYESTVQASDVEPCTITATQTAAAEFVSFNSATASPGKAGGALTISGKSNSSKLTFSFESSPTPTLVLPAVTTYKANNANATSGTAITGDPGATAEYTFSVEFNVPENETIGSLSCVLLVTSAGGQTSRCTITQAAGDAYLWVGEENQTELTVTIPAIGTAQVAQVLSNTEWTIS